MVNATDHFLIGSIQVNGLESASSLSVGSQVVVGGSSHTKSVIGHGSIVGDLGSMPSLGGWIMDNDFVDTPTWAFTGVLGTAKEW
jgi:hypothetical protein